MAQKKSKRMYKQSFVSYYQKLINKLTIIISIFGPLMTLPQVLTIFLTQNASGVSSITWLSYVLTSIIWLSYGLIHKITAIQINSSIGLLLSSLVFLGTYLYS